LLLYGAMGTWSSYGCHVGLNESVTGRLGEIRLQPNHIACKPAYMPHADALQIFVPGDLVTYVCGGARVLGVILVVEVAWKVPSSNHEFRKRNERNETDSPLPPSQKPLPFLPVRVAWQNLQSSGL
jgi:hypothetical protein